MADKEDVVLSTALGECCCCRGALQQDKSRGVPLNEVAVAVGRRLYHLLPALSLLLLL